MEMEQRKKFALNIGKLRDMAGISQQQLSNETGISRETIAKYETSKRIPSYEHLTILAKYFSTTTDYLLGLTDDYSCNNDSRCACDYLNLNSEAINFIKRHSEAFKVLIKIKKFEEFIPNLYKSACQNIQEAIIIKELKSGIYSGEICLKVLENANNVHNAKEIQEYKTQKLFFNILSEAYHNYPESDAIYDVNQYLSDGYYKEAPDNGKHTET